MSVVTPLRRRPQTVESQLSPHQEPKKTTPKLQIPVPTNGETVSPQHLKAYIQKVYLEAPVPASPPRRRASEGDSEKQRRRMVQIYEPSPAKGARSNRNASVPTIFRVVGQERAEDETSSSPDAFKPLPPLPLKPRVKPVDTELN
jgi:hypothetical protein